MEAVGGRGGGRGGARGGVGAGAKVAVEAHPRFPGVYVSRGKDDLLMTKNSTVGESVYNEKRVSAEVSRRTFNIPIVYTVIRETDTPILTLDFQVSVRLTNLFCF